jgi:SAM-dependent methyltransferase
MTPTAYQLREFYKTLGGRIARRLIRERIERMIGSVSGLRVLGGGYAVPYLSPFMENTERTVSVMFTGQGVHHWPDDNAANITCLANETELPFETNSVDRIILVHSLEFTGFLQPAFEEFYRVLKSNGRILIIVPNRMGLWSRADWTPFGHGQPYSASQVEHFLADNKLAIERTEKGLFIPPFKSQLLLRSAAWWEKIGNALFPAMGGLIFVEASKQIYAGTARPVRSAVKTKPVIAGTTPEAV